MDDSRPSVCSNDMHESKKFLVCQHFAVENVMSIGDDHCEKISSQFIGRTQADKQAMEHNIYFDFSINTVNKATFQ